MVKAEVFIAVTAALLVIVHKGMWNFKLFVCVCACAVASHQIYYCVHCSSIQLLTYSYMYAVHNFLSVGACNGFFYFFYLIAFFLLFLS